jgi:predicted GIY-YIG superfamily endonuclease
LSALPRLASLVAERAVRFLRARNTPVSSTRLAEELLATKTGSEEQATTVLRAAFGSDTRLRYSDDAWELTEAAAQKNTDAPEAELQKPPEPDRVLIYLRGVPQSRGNPYELTSISALRLDGSDVVAACGGDTAKGPAANRLRRSIIEILHGAIPVIHDPPGAIKALNRWLGEPLELPLSLRKLGRTRLGLRLNHDLETLIAKLGLDYYEADDPLEQATNLDDCLQALLKKDESVQDLRASINTGPPMIDWSRYAFNRDFLRNVPKVPGTYYFYTADNTLLYVGKSKNLHQRLASYFRESGTRTVRVQKLLDAIHRIEYEHTGSALEAALREAELIRKGKPKANVQRNVQSHMGRASRLQSILILEPAAPPAVLRAYLIRRGCLVDRVTIGPKGGGLGRIKRVLDDHFFFAPEGPTPINGPDLDVEIVVRWLAENRDRVVAFDPTNLPTADEVIDRLRWFLNQGTPFNPDGSPIFTQ